MASLPFAEENALIARALVEFEESQRRRNAEGDQEAIRGLAKRIVDLERGVPKNALRLKPKDGHHHMEPVRMLENGTDKGFGFEIDVVGGSVTRGTGLDNRKFTLNVGGIGPFEYDYLVDANFAALVAAGTYSEGDEFTTFHGHTFLVYSEPLAAAVHATANRTTSGQDTTFFIVGGDYTLASALELTTGGTFQVHRWIGSGPDNVTLIAGANSMDIININGEGAGSSEDPTFYIENIGFVDDGKTTVDGIDIEPAVEVHIQDCRFTMSGANIAIDNSSGDTRGVWINDCYLKGASSGKAIRLGQLGSVVAQSSFISGNEFVGAWGVGIESNASKVQLFTHNDFNACAIGISFRGAAFQTESIVANNVFQVGLEAGIRIRQANPNSNANIAIIGNTFSSIGSSQEGIDVSEVHASSAVFGLNIIGNTFAGEGSASAAAIRGNATANKVVNSLLTSNIFRDFVSGTEYPDWDVGPGNEAFHNISTDESGTPHPKQALADIGSPVGHVGTAADLPGHTHEDGDEGGGTLTPTNLKWAAATELTISSGAITVTQSHHTIDTEADAATDDLDTINGLVANQLYFLRPESGARTIVLKHGTGNILCIGNADLPLDDVQDFVWAFSPDGSTVYVGLSGAGGGAGHTEDHDHDGDPTQQLAATNILLPTIGSPTFDDVEDLNTLFHSAGWFSGGAISDAGGATIDVAAGTGALRATDSQTAQLLFFDWPASSGLAITANSIRYVGVEYNAGTPQVVVRTSNNWNFNTDFPLGTVVNESGTLHRQFAPWEIGDHASAMIERVRGTAPIARDKEVGGIIFSESGTRRVVVSAGQLWRGLTSFTIAAIDTDPGGGADTFDTYSAGGQEATGASQWPNEQYDNAGTLTTLGNNKWANLWWYIELDGELVMVYGTAQYNSEALAGEESPPSTLPNRLQVHGILAARFIFQKSAGTAAQILSAFDAPFTPSGVTLHADLGTVTSDQHHTEAHAPETHTGQGATAAELETLTDGSDADALHNHPSDLTPAEHTSIGDSSPHHSNATDHSNASDHAESHDYDTHSGGVPYAEVEYDDATSDPLIDADSASDGIENSAARKDHAHPKHHDNATDHANTLDHAEAHAPETHTGQGATAAELETLTDASDADALHGHSNHGVTRHSSLTVKEEDGTPSVANVNEIKVANGTLTDNTGGSVSLAGGGGGGAPDAHKDSHDPNDGSDALDSANASEIAGVQAAGTGTSHSLARADHAHQIQHGITDNHLVTIDGPGAGAPANGEYAKWTANGLEGKSTAEVASDIEGSISHDSIADVSAVDHHSNADDHAESHTLLSHSTVPEISDVVTFTGTPNGVTIAGGTFNLPAAPFGLIEITGEGNTDDILADILTNAGSQTLVPGTKIWLTNKSGNAITIVHNAIKIFLQLGTNVILESGGIDIICLQAINTSIWTEYDRSPSLQPVASTTVSGRVELATADQTKAASSAALAVTPVSLIAALEVPMEFKIPLADPIIASADSTLTPAPEYKKPWADAVRRMGAWSVKFESNVGGDVTFKLQKNAGDVAGSTLTIASGTAESGTTPFPPESFTEFTLAANDVLTVVQTTARTDAIQAVATIYGYERVVPAGDTL